MSRADEFVKGNQLKVNMFSYKDLQEWKYVDFLKIALLFLNSQQDYFNEIESNMDKVL